MNPQYFSQKKIIEVMQTIVHEMVHQWQSHFGTKKSQKSYHNKEWAEKMEFLGLMPSTTGQPGGKKTGQKMSDYPIEAGIFLQSCERLITPEYKISWMDKFNADASEETEKPTNKSNRIKYTCPTCLTNIWGKPELNVVCGDCKVPFLPDVKE